MFHFDYINANHSLIMEEISSEFYQEVDKSTRIIRILTAVVDVCLR